MKTSGAQRGRILSDLWWSLALAWDCSPGLLSAIVLAGVVRGLTPVGLAIAGREIVNAVAAGVQTGSAPAGLPFWIGVGLGVAILDSIARSSNALCSALMEQKLDLRINSDILAHADELELSRFEDPRFQDTLARARDNVSRNFIKCLTDAMTAFSDALQALSLIGLLVRIDPLIVLLVLPLGLPYLLHQWKFSRMRRELIYTRSRKSRWTHYFIRQLTTQQAAPEVKALGLGPLLRERYREIADAFLTQDRRIQQHKFVFDVAYIIVSTAAAYMAFFRVAVGTLAGRTTVGDVAIFGGAALRLAVTIEDMVNHVAAVRERVQHAANLREFLEIEPDTTRAHGPMPATCRGDIELQDVTFHYPGSPTPALRNVSFKIRAGETVALVGENGSGKTTLAKLVSGLYEPTAGRVLLDGRALGTLPREFLRRHIAIVFQEYARYEATAADNIAYGDWELSRQDPDLVRRAAALAGIEGLIRTMPHTYDTMLGREFGEFTLSVGQWQQLALARAVAKKSAVLVLDEPTASLDALAERRLADHFADIADGRTTILVSHRFSTIGIADRIVVLADGRVVEQGTHDELLVANGRYTELHDTYRAQVRR
jgi:ATP-binding cassette subfamily B protein